MRFLDIVPICRASISKYICRIYIQEQEREGNQMRGFLDIRIRDTNEKTSKAIHVFCGFNISNIVDTSESIISLPDFSVWLK
jgi:hypothetical protein